jgi:hypothetical protein
MYQTNYSETYGGGIKMEKRFFVIQNPQTNKFLCIDETLDYYWNDISHRDLVKFNTEESAQAHIKHHVEVSSRDDAEDLRIGVVKEVICTYTIVGEGKDHIVVEGAVYKKAPETFGCRGCNFVRDSWDSCAHPDRTKIDIGCRSGKFIFIRV